LRTKLLALAIFIFFALIIAGCQGKTAEKEKENGIITVYTTIFPIEDFTKKIGGKHVSVKSVYPAGADAHTFEPTMKTMMEIADSDLFIYNGAGLEGFVEKMKTSMKNENVTMVEATKGIDLISDGHGHSEEHADHEEADHDADPHVWLDPVYAVTMAENIKNALLEKKPDAKADFEKNFESVKAKLKEIDAELRKTVDSAKRKEILVSHASYGYWEQRYGLKQISIAGLSPEHEPSQKQLQSIIEKVKKERIPYIIYDQNPLTRITETIQEETGTKPLTLHNLEYITAEDEKNNEDYFSIMESNIANLKKAVAE
jgi:zinc transport system substrate-binding protein